MDLSIYVSIISSFSQRKHSMLFHTARVMAISWSPDSKLIVSGGIDTNICVWNAEKGDRIQEIKGKKEGRGGEGARDLFYIAH